METWKDVVGYEGVYEISDQMGIRSLDRVDCVGRKRVGANMKTKRNHFGYATICLTSNSARSYPFLHVLVAEAFLGHVKTNGLQVNHIDHNKGNWTLDNLNLLTPKDNTLAAVAFGAIKKGGARVDARLSDLEAQYIIWMVQAGESKVNVSKMFGISNVIGEMALLALDGYNQGLVKLLAGAKIGLVRIS
jgi:hypothetical protein